jgi:hypothetical protein
MFQALKRERGLGASTCSLADILLLLSFKPSSGNVAWEPEDIPLPWKRVLLCFKPSSGDAAC